MMRAIKLVFSSLAVLLLDAAIVFLSGCSFNKQLVDTTYGYDAAIVLLPDGQIISGQLDSWMDYSDGDQIQVVIDGKTYLVHANNVTLISD